MSSYLLSLSEGKTSFEVGFAAKKEQGRLARRFSWIADICYASARVKFRVESVDAVRQVPIMPTKR